VDGSITVTKSALVKLVDGMLYPTQMIPVARAICGGRMAPSAQLSAELCTISRG
jgi:hypothetical protein